MLYYALENGGERSFLVSQPGLRDDFLDQLTGDFWFFLGFCKTSL